jgi:hypothetical protein
MSLPLVDKAGGVNKLWPMTSSHAGKPLTLQGPIAVNQFVAAKQHRKDES